jgi:hypothetical protein
MSKWIYTREDGERVEFEADDHEMEALVAAQEAAEEENEDDDNDEQDSDESDDEPSREADSAEEFARVEGVYRKERAAIKASNDATDLRRRRQAMEGVLRDARQSNIAHTRARDLLGEIEQRELRILAERPGNRGR